MSETGELERDGRRGRNRRGDEHVAGPPGHAGTAVNQKSEECSSSHIAQGGGVPHLVTLRQERSADSGAQAT